MVESLGDRRRRKTTRMQIRWEEDALADLIDLRTYLSENNPESANRMANKIINATNLLADYPMLGKVGRIHKTRELVISGTPYTLIYLPESDLISILRIFHQSRSWNNFLRKA